MISFPSTISAITKGEFSRYHRKATKRASKIRKKPTLTSSPIFLTPNHGITELALNPASPSSHVELTPTAILLPSQLKATAATPPGNFGYCLNRFLTLWSQIDTVPSEPAEAKVLNVGWKARELTGQTWSTSLIVCLWHLKAYFLSWEAGEGSKYSTAIRPSTEAVAYPNFDFVNEQGGMEVNREWRIRTFTVRHAS